jgi:hypothetical protein
VEKLLKQSRTKVRKQFCNNLERVLEINSSKSERIKINKKNKEKGIKNVFYYIGSKSAIPAPQMGQTQSDGKSSKAVPGGMLPSGSPFSGSYS